MHFVLLTGFTGVVACRRGTAIAIFYERALFSFLAKGLIFVLLFGDLLLVQIFVIE